MSDAWSLGIVLWELVTQAREQPFENIGQGLEHCQTVLWDAIHDAYGKGEQVPLDFPVHCPTAYRAIVERCCQFLPSKRVRPEDVVNYLEDRNVPDDNSPKASDDKHIYD